jgi:type III restriction enzyme
MNVFNFEKNLSHQSHAVDSTIKVFENIHLVPPTEVEKNYINPVFDYLSDRAYTQNLRKVMDANGIKETIKPNSNIIDIMMETGTGKTYTYTKTIFELNKHYGIFKFIMRVPSELLKNASNQSVFIKLTSSF